MVMQNEGDGLASVLERVYDLQSMIMMQSRYAAHRWEASTLV